ncbi:MAG: cyanophycinase [Roseiflexaceae bacterium]
MDNVHRSQPGAIALVGSGEYTQAMNETDRLLLDTLADPGAARVALLPTASAREEGARQRWNRMGAEHFAALGAQVAPLLLLTRDDAADPQILAALRAADLFYFSGGDPQHLVETLRDTPAWDAIRERHAGGAVIAGCSAGAMMLGGYTMGIRALMNGQPPQWPAALGLLPRIAVMPHFDRAAQFVGEELFRVVIAAAPTGVTLIGVDEDTALLHLPAVGWRVLGRQTVSIFDGVGGRAIYHAGDRVPLEDRRS